MTTESDFMASVVARKRERLISAKADVSLDSLRPQAHATRSGAARYAFRNALRDGGRINIIAEIKRASPSTGDFGLRATVEKVACAYSRGGASALSVLTEEDYFRGSLEDLRAARRAVSLPVLRKDFVFDEYQLYESAAAGADALLLIAALLDDDELWRLRNMTETELGMDALVEVHTREEMIRAVASGATLIGVNNRNLHTFEVSLDVSRQLIDDAPAGAILVSESGLKTGAELRQLRDIGYKAFLIGETLISAESAEDALRTLMREAQD